MSGSNGRPAGSRGRRALRATAAAAVLLFVVFVVVAWMAKPGSRIADWDVRITDAVVGWRDPSWSRVFWVFSVIGNARVLVPLSAAVVLPLVAWGKRVRATIVCGGLLVTWAATYLMKALVDRDRPPEALALVRPPISQSMPSGHAVVTMVFCGLLAWMAVSWLDARTRESRRARGSRRSWRVTFLKWCVGLVMAIVIVFVGASRVYLGVHWTSDVLAGWCLGAAVLMATIVGSVTWERACRSRRFICDSVPFAGAIRRSLLAVIGVALVVATVLTALADPLR